jgi:hypothetical protein
LRRLLAGLLILTLAGCARVEPITEVLAQGEPAAISEFKEVLDASIELFDNEGMTETLIAENDKYVISYQPTEKFVAGLYHENLKDFMVIDRRGVFTIFLVQEMAAKETTTISKTDLGFLVASPGLEDVELKVVDSIFASAKATDGRWSSTFDYKPDEFVLGLLEGR